MSLAALYLVIAFGLVGLYAPFLASSKPLIVYYDGNCYFPLFRYLFYPGFFTKRLDLFFNLLMFTLPLGIGAIYLFRKKRLLVIASIALISIFQVGLFFLILFSPPKDPQADPTLNRIRQDELARHPVPSWSFDLYTMSPYARLNLLLKKSSNENLTPYMQERAQWVKEEQKKLHLVLMPLLRPYHWEDDAGGSQSLNQIVPWWELTRTNGKDLVAALLFGVRISFVVGLVAVAIALAIAIPVGSFAGYYGGTFDIVVSRLLEIWESMPTFFMLLLVVAVTRSKSIFLVIAVIGFFGWTGFSRFLRGEFFKQRNLPYVEACRALGYKDSRIIFSHILPNAVPPLLTLLPFAIMGAITSEAGLSFLGLGEEGSCSWGVLMDEGRQAFPGQSYLLWPPAILLTILLVAIALVGDGLRDALDPKS